jgi:hypothetical protein
MLQISAETKRMLLRAIVAVLVCVGLNALVAIIFNTASTHTPKTYSIFAITESMVILRYGLLLLCAYIVLGQQWVVAPILLLTCSWDYFSPAQSVAYHFLPGSVFSLLVQFFAVTSVIALVCNCTQLDAEDSWNGMTHGDTTAYCAIFVIAFAVTI